MAISIKKSNNIAEGSKAIYLMPDEAQCQTQLDADLAKYYEEDQRFLGLHCEPELE